MEQSSSNSKFTEEKISPSKSGLQLGIFFGIIMVLEFVITYVIDIDPITNPTVGMVFQILNYLILPVTFIFMGCDNYKKKLNGGFISFGECLKIGVSICIIAGLIFALFNTVFNMIFPEYIEEVLRKMRQVMISQNSSMTSDQLDMAISMTKKFMNPMFSIPMTLIMFSFIGLIYSLIIGAFIKNEKPQSF